MRKVYCEKRTFEMGGTVYVTYLYIQWVAVFLAAMWVET